MNVHMRGVLHVVDPASRPCVVASLRAMLGRRGTLYVCETDLPGDPLDYLVSLGVTPTSMPAAIRLLVSSGLRPPTHFGASELARYFPSANGWRLLADGRATMYGVPRRPREAPQPIPSYYGVLRSTPGG